MPVVQINNLTKEYDGLTAVDNFNLEVDKGEIIGLLGPNGAGKTTIINMILGIVEPSDGKIEVFGKDIQKFRPEIAEKMNFSAVYAHLPPNITVLQNLRIFGLLYGVKNLNERIKSLVEEFELKDFENKKTGLLSSGEISRLNLAKAVINNPELLLLDEPTASLDPNIADIIREKIKNYVKKTGAAVLWTSHNMLEIERVCDKVFFLSHGKIVLSGDPKTLAKEHNKKDLEELFITVAREPLSIATNP
jgi:ABC-2 type transport system ATP-binding protein